MKIVIVKHENFPNKYIFEVPENENVKYGQMVKVNTRFGETTAVCLTPDFEIDEEREAGKLVLSSFGATLPLKKVIGKYYYYDFATSINNILTYK